MAPLYAGCTIETIYGCLLHYILYRVHLELNLALLLLPVRLYTLYTVYIVHLAMFTDDCYTVYNAFHAACIQSIWRCSLLPVTLYTVHLALFTAACYIIYCPFDAVHCCLLHYIQSIWCCSLLTITLYTVHLALFTAACYTIYSPFGAVHCCLLHYIQSIWRCSLLPVTLDTICSAFSTIYSWLLHYIQYIWRYYTWCKYVTLYPTDFLPTPWKCWTGVLQHCRVWRIATHWRSAL